MTESEWPGSPDHYFWKAVRGEMALSPAGDFLHWTVLDAEPGAGTARVRFVAPPELGNPLGNVQGGFLGAMLDDAMSTALATTLQADELGPTLEMKVSFLRPGRIGTFVGDARIVHRGRGIAFVEGTLADADGVVVATATMTARIVKGAPPG